MCAQPALQRPNERVADGLIVGGLDAVRDVALGQRARRGQHGAEIVEPVDDDRKRRHQLAALLFHVAAKQRLDRGCDLEQPAVEQGGGFLGDGRDLLEALLDRRHLFRRHRCSPGTVSPSCASIQASCQRAAAPEMTRRQRLTRPLSARGILCLLIAAAGCGNSGHCGTLDAARSSLAGIFSRRRDFLIARRGSIFMHSRDPGKTAIEMRKPWACCASVAPNTCAGS